ncbi:MAG: type III secretion system chaperone [Planctomycetes bacterium]|nr:type III secretion system chaperone [Planctomycetota bacterium]
MTDVRNLVLELAEGMGLDGLPLDANGVTCIQFDDLLMNIHADREAGEITLFLKIGDIPPSAEAKLAVYAYLLKRNNFSRHTGGCVLGIDEEEEAAYFSHRFAAGHFTVQQLERMVEAFLNLADTFVAGFQEAAASVDGETSAPVQAGMRV